GIFRFDRIVLQRRARCHSSPRAINLPCPDGLIRANMNIPADLGRRRRYKLAQQTAELLVSIEIDRRRYRCAATRTVYLDRNLRCGASGSKSQTRKETV